MARNNGCGNGCGNSCGNNCGCCDERIEKFTTDDGRKGEKHYKCCDGQQVVEIYAEEHRPLHLEKRILQERDEIVVREIHEEICDGNITKQDVYDLDPATQMEHRQSLGTVPCDTIYRGECVRQDPCHAGPAEPAPDMSAMNLQAQSLLEDQVKKSGSGSGILNWVLGAILISQLAFFAYALLSLN